MNIAQIIDKYTCIDILGNRVVKKVANGYLARAPWREDNHPSVTVTLNGRGWHDLTTGEHGNVIDLVAQWKGLTKSEVCSWFDTFMPGSSSFPPQKIYGGKGKDAFKLFEVGPLRSRGLYAYLYQRKVNIDIAKQFLQEAHYSFEPRTDGSYLYALAYANDKGGYELRSRPYRGNPEGYKGCTSPKGITTHFIKDNAPMVVFEGFFDMLSFATMCGGVRHNYVVLNSCSMKESALEVLQSYTDKIYLSLDNDEGGEETTAWLLQHLPTAKDIRSRFAPHKDVNEYLMQK